MKTTFGQRALDFYCGLSGIRKLPAHIEAMNPYRRPEVREYAGKFLRRFFSDNRPRTLILGINPGRFGAGITGVTFTDPVALEQFCGVPNALPKKRELSSVFIYDVIKNWGGPEKFYGDFFLTAVSPLGFTRHGKNYNYYDEPDLFRAVKPFIVQTLKAQLLLGARRDVAVLLGLGKNQKMFGELNQEHGFFGKILAVEHPRFILQYRRKKTEEYLRKYAAVLKEALEA